MLLWMSESRNSLLLNKLTASTRCAKVLRSDRGTVRDALDTPRDPEQSG
jgi:hypothetical protein